MSRTIYSERHTIASSEIWEGNPSILLFVDEINEVRIYFECNDSRYLLFKMLILAVEAFMFPRFALVISFVLLLEARPGEGHDGHGGEGCPCRRGP